MQTKKFLCILRRRSFRFDLTKSIFGVALIGTVCLLAPAQAWSATPPRAVVLAPSDTFQTTSGKSVIYCGRIGGRWLAGTLKSTGAFTSNAARITALKKDLSKARTSSAKKALNNSIAAAQRKEKKEALICRTGPVTTPTPTPVPTEGGTPSPVLTPTPTPTPVQAGCYNAAGNTQCFGIPSGLTGNITRGQQAFQSFCASCHSGGNQQVEPRNRSFSQLGQAFSSVPQMSLYNGTLSDATVSDLVAYLNRFNPNQ